MYAAYYGGGSATAGADSGSGNVFLLLGDPQALNASRQGRAFSVVVISVLFGLLLTSAFAGASWVAVQNAMRAAGVAPDGFDMESTAGTNGGGMRKVKKMRRKNKGPGQAGQAGTAQSMDSHASL